MISVVMANYNGEQFLAEALESVAAQDFNDFEMIVVDDGSTDGSRGVIESFADKIPDFRPVFLPENRGQAAGFNTGAAQARGELVAFMDSDDLWFPNKLSRLDALWKSVPDGVLFEHNLLIHQDGQPTDKRFRETLVSGDVFKFTQRTRVFPLFVPTSGLAFPKWVLDTVMPVPEVFRTCADGYLTRTAMTLGRVVATEECLGYYRKHGGNQVFGNQAHDAARYQRERLLPSLNAFYRKQGISFRFPVPPLWKLVLQGKVKQVARLLG